MKNHVVTWVIHWTPQCNLFPHKDTPLEMVFDTFRNIVRPWGKKQKGKTHGWNFLIIIILFFSASVLCLLVKQHEATWVKINELPNDTDSKRNMYYYYVYLGMMFEDFQNNNMPVIRTQEARTMVVLTVDRPYHHCGLDFPCSNKSSSNMS